MSRHYGTEIIQTLQAIGFSPDLYQVNKNGEQYSVELNAAGLKRMSMETFGAFGIGIIALLREKLGIINAYVWAIEKGSNAGRPARVVFTYNGERQDENTED